MIRCVLTILVLTMASGCSKGKTDIDCISEDLCSSRGYCTAKGEICVVGSNNDCKRSNPCKSLGKCMMKDGECVEGGEAPAGSPFAKKALAEAAAKAKAAKDARIATYRAWTPAERLSSAGISGADLSKAEHIRDELVAACPNDDEKLDVERAFNLHRSSALMLKSKDGDKITVTPAAISLLRNVRIPDIRKLDKTSLRATLKDPEAARGKWMSVRARITQVRKSTKHKDTFWAILTTPRGRTIYALTPGPTEGILDGQWRTFTGIVAQRYWYQNVSGGQTESIVVIGHFKGQGMG